MWMKDNHIDHGMAFDWGRTSLDYAKYRDIYPDQFYEKILDRDLCRKGQTVLDIGTGTGVIPRNLYRYGAKWIGTDISENQIEQAKILSQGMDIEYDAIPAESISFQDNSFDVITACQCFWYFKHEIAAPVFWKVLKPNGRMLILYMAWLPFEDEIAGASENLVLKYNPNWSGAGEKMHPIELPKCYERYFDAVYHEEYLVNVHFTRESWNGRMKACQGIGATLSEAETNSWEKEHKKLLSHIAPDEFDVLHYGAILELKTNK